MFCLSRAGAAITINHTTVRAESDPLVPIHMKGRTPVWQLVLPKHALMAHPHCEDDAQHYHELDTSQFHHDFDARRVTRLRICCFQPSPLWKEYGLRNVRFWSVELPTPPTLQQPPPNLTSAHKELASTIAEHMMDLANITQQIHETIATAKQSSRRGRSGRRSASDDDLSDVVPYILGEWNDELRLVPKASSSSTPSNAASSHRDAPAYHGDARSHMSKR